MTDPRSSWGWGGGGWGGGGGGGGGVWGGLGGVGCGGVTRNAREDTNADPESSATTDQKKSGRDPQKAEEGLSHAACAWRSQRYERRCKAARVLGKNEALRPGKALRGGRRKKKKTGQEIRSKKRLSRWQDGCLARRKNSPARVTRGRTRMKKEKKKKRETKLKKVTTAADRLSSERTEKAGVSLSSLGQGALIKTIRNATAEVQRNQILSGAS